MTGLQIYDVVDDYSLDFKINIYEIETSAPTWHEYSSITALEHFLGQLQKLI